MTSTPVNLNKARKARAKADKAKRADANRALHGLTKAGRKVAEAKRKADAARLDGHKLEQ